ncbi:6-bladed beta-propeller [Prolixibacteraceae bacterium JC049]|nr:6-bladed beta-propeller [Prolixibacteraceae bacterium JC049]
MRILYFFCLLLLCSCSSSSKDKRERIHIPTGSNDTIYLSKIMQRIDTIRLVTSVDNIIPAIRQLACSREYFFISSGNKLFQMDKNGKFVRHIGHQGKGPQEFEQINGICCSEKYLYISSLRKILCFNFDGEYQFTINTDYWADAMQYIDDELWVIAKGFGSKSEIINRTFVKRFQANGAEKDSICLKQIKVKRQVGAMLPGIQYISDLGNEKMVYCPVLVKLSNSIDTLFSMKGNKLIPTKIIEVDNPTPDKSKLLIKNIFQTNRYLWAEYRHDGENKLFCYDLKSRKGINSFTFMVDDKFNTGEIRLLPVDLKNNKLYFQKQGYELEEIMPNYTEDSNPMLFVVYVND